METLEYPGAFQPRSGTASVGHHLSTAKLSRGDTQTRTLGRRLSNHATQTDQKLIN